MSLVLAEKLALASQCAYAIEFLSTDGKDRFSDYSPCKEIGYEGVPLSKNVDGGTDAYLMLETREHVIIALRGTLPPKEYFDLAVSRDWANDIFGSNKDAFEEFPGKVHAGFRESMHNLYRLIRSDLEQLQSSRAQAKPLLITGHSKGGALAGLLAYRLAIDTGVVPDAVYTFGAPRAVDHAFAQEYARLAVNHWRFEYETDFVPHFPQDGEVVRWGKCGDDKQYGLLQVFGDYTHLGQLEYLVQGARSGQNEAPIILSTCADTLRIKRINQINDKIYASACGEKNDWLIHGHKMETYVNALHQLNQAGKPTPNQLKAIQCGWPVEWAPPRSQFPETSQGGKS